MNEKLLWVDDDPNILQAFQRQLRKQFRIETASGGAEGLECVTSTGPYAVVVSDMRMPGMNGIQFLSAVKERSPESVRIMLTGYADRQTAIDAVNEGQIFRFLTKPCPPETLVKTLAAGVRQYQLVTAERELLEKTLRGCIKVLIDVLALTNPAAFGHSTRVRSLVQKLCRHLKVDKQWQCEVAAMLSQIGCVTVPPSTLDDVFHGRELSLEDAQMFDAHPSVGRDLVGNIPRLETVSEIIAYQRKCFDGSGTPADSLSGKDIPLGARILKVALDFHTLKWSGLEDSDVVTALHQQIGHYDPEVLDALEVVIGLEESLVPQEVGVHDLTAHMVLADDVLTTEGALLINKGQEVTAVLCEHLKNFARNGRIADRIRVLVRAECGSRAAPSTA